MDRLEAHREVEALIVSLTTNGKFDKARTEQVLRFIEQDRRAAADQLPRSLAQILQDEADLSRPPATYDEAAGVLRDLLDG